MTAATAVAAARLGAGARARVSADAIAVGVLFLLTGALALATWGTWGDIGSDTGYDLVAGARVAQGELPYADFVYYYGPLAPALLGLAALVGGNGLAPGIAVGLALASGIVVATYGLGRLVAGPVGAFLAAAITAGVAFEPTNFSFVLPHTYSATLALLCTLGFLLALGRERTTLAGTLAGLVALTRPEFAAAVAVAGVVWLLAKARARVLRRGEVLRLAGPALAIPAFVYGALLIAVSPRRLLLDNLYPVDELRSGASTVLGAYAPFTLGSLAELGGKLLLYAAGVALLVAAAGGVARAGRRTRVSLGAAAALAAAVAAALDSEALRSGLYLAYGWIPAGALVVLAALAVVAWRRREPSARTHLELAALAALAVLAAKTYAAFIFHAAPNEQFAAYAAPLAALFLVRLHLGPLARTRTAAAAGALWLGFLAAAGAGLTLKDARAESATVSGPGGTLRATPAEAETYSQVLRWIEAGTRPSDPVLLAPQLTSLNVLSGRQSPLDRISLLPGALSGPREERAAIERLDAAGVRLAVIDRRPLSEYGQGAFGTTFAAALQRWLASEFTLARTYRSGETPRPVEIWLRRDS